MSAVRFCESAPIIIIRYKPVCYKVNGLFYSILNYGPVTVEYKISLMERRLPLVHQLAKHCRLCPHQCEINRLNGEVGTCRIGSEPVYSSANLHFGEEPPISGTRGSGTIFMTGCNLRCLLCQNYPISQLRHGITTNPDQLAEKMLSLQRQRAHNINFVTPTHQAAILYETLLTAFRRGLDIPIVYNCGGYESVEMLKFWDGIIDIYMPDSKYADDQSAEIISHAPDYVSHNRAALLEMHRQVGILQLDDDGIAVRGLLIRHLVLPEGLTNSAEVLRFIAEELSPDTYISLMSQYFPAWKAVDHEFLRRRVSKKEYGLATQALKRYNLNNGWTQPF